jgi:hypothetical protein
LSNFRTTLFCDIRTVNVCPKIEKRGDPEAWKAVLSVLYNKDKIDPGPEATVTTFFDGEFISSAGGFPVRIPTLSEDEKSYITPYIDTLTPEMEEEYDAYFKGTEPRREYIDPSYHAQLKSGIYFGKARYEVEYMMERIWKTIEDVTGQEIPTEKRTVLWKQPSCTLSKNEMDFLYCDNCGQKQASSVKVDKYVCENCYYVVCPKCFPPVPYTNSAYKGKVACSSCADSLWGQGLFD